MVRMLGLRPEERSTVAVAAARPDSRPRVSRSRRARSTPSCSRATASGRSPASTSCWGSRCSSRPSGCRRARADRAGSDVPRDPGGDPRDRGLDGSLLDDAGWVYRALWLLRGAAEFLVGLAVWGLAGLVTDTRQAKRWFPLIGGAAVLGQVAGGLLTKPLAAWLGTDALILVWSATLVAVVALRRRLVAIAGAEAPRSRRRRPSAVADLLGGPATRSAPRSCAGCRSARSCSRCCSSRCTSRSPARRWRGSPSRRTRGVPRAVRRDLDGGDAAAVAVRDEPAARPRRHPGRDDGPADPVPGRVRRPHGRGVVRDPARVPLRPGRVAAGWGLEHVGGRDQHGPGRPPRPDAGVPLRRPDPGGHGARRDRRADR